MKINFDDKSYIEIVKSVNSDKFFISIAAKSKDNQNSLVVNSVELTKEQVEAFLKSEF